MGTSSLVVIGAVPSSDILGAVKRQHRSPAEKRKIVEATSVPGASVARVARARGVNANQVFSWRRLYRNGRLGTPSAGAARLLPVRLSEATGNEVRPPCETEATTAMAVGQQAAGEIHLELRKARLRIEGHVDSVLLRLVLKAVLE